MQLHLTILDPQHRPRQFSCQLEQLEQSFDMLNQLVAEGNKLVTALLDDGRAVSYLPVDSFDGQPILKLIQNLERGWQSILAAPPLTVNSVDPI